MPARTGIGVGVREKQFLAETPAASGYFVTLRGKKLLSGRRRRTPSRFGRNPISTRDSLHD
jgi:hypothetical protein